MGSPRNPLFGIDINLNVNAEDFIIVAQMVLDHLAGPTNERMERLEEAMRRTDTLIRELKEGIAAMKEQQAAHQQQHEAEQAAEAVEDQEAADRDTANAARIAELEALVTELRSRELTPEKQQELEAAVEELAALTGNVITDDEEAQQ